MARPCETLDSKDNNFLVGDFCQQVVNDTFSKEAQGILRDIAKQAESKNDVRHLLGNLVISEVL